MQEEAVYTPTVIKAKAAQQARADKHYVFHLDEGLIEKCRDYKLPDCAVVALGAIVAAAYGSRSEDWVTLPVRTIDAYSRGYRWWHRATSALEAAGLIEARRHPGRLPRYRLLVKAG